MRSVLLRSLFCAALLSELAATHAAQASFREDFEGLGLNSVERFSSPHWDVSVHSRDPSWWFTLEPMPAAHGLDASPPPATHTISAYEDTVYNAKEHLMTAINAPSYGMVYLTPDVLVDLQQGEATVRFDMSTLRTARRDWIDLWITPWEDNLQLPLDDDLPDVHGTPRRGIHLRMDTFNAQVPGSTAVDWSFFRTEVFEDYAVRERFDDEVLGYEDVLVPDPRRRETFELQLSRTHVRFGMPDYGLWWVDEDIAPLDWDKGVIQFGHHSYNPTKTAAPVGHDTALAGVNDPEANTWHWDAFEVLGGTRFRMVGADRRFVRDTGSTKLVLDEPAPYDGFLRFSAIGGVELSFDGAPFVAALRQDGSLQAAGEDDPFRFSSYWTPIPEGTLEVDLRLTRTTFLESVAKDFAVWSLSAGHGDCTGSVGTPRIAVGAPLLGSVQDHRLEGALPGATGILTLSLAEVPREDCGPALDLTPGILQVPGPLASGLVLVDPQGRARVDVPLPAVPSLGGLVTYAQWLVLDPAGAFPAGSFRLAASELRRSVLR